MDKIPVTETLSHESRRTLTLTLRRLTYVNGGRAQRRGPKRGPAGRRGPGPPARALPAGPRAPSAAGARPRHAPAGRRGPGDCAPGRVHLSREVS